MFLVDNKLPGEKGPGKRRVVAGSSSSRYWECAERCTLLTPLIPGEPVSDSSRSSALTQKLKQVGGGR